MTEYYEDMVHQPYSNSNECAAVLPEKPTDGKRQRKRPQEVYIIEYAISENAKETVEEKLKRLMMNEAERIFKEKVS